MIKRPGPDWNDTVKNILARNTIFTGKVNSSLAKIAANARLLM
jgi:hypothetical protein